MNEDIHELEELLRIATIMHRALDEHPDDSPLMAEEAERLDGRKKSLRGTIRCHRDDHLRESWREGSHTLVEDSRALMADDAEDEGLRELVSLVREAGGAIPLDELAARGASFELLCLGVVQGKLSMYISAGTLVVGLCK